MRVHRAYWNLPGDALHGVVAIGNFDGVHRGHRELIATARARAAGLGSFLGVITFEPHPREVLTPAEAPPRLTPIRAKALLLAEQGVERLYALPFTAMLREKTAESFVHDVLAGGLGVRHVVVGYDFRFGYQARGDARLLQVLGAEYGFGVDVVEPVRWRGHICSSSRIRDALREGEVALARDLLGHPFVVEGHVVPGDRRGRALGYATANLRPPMRGRVLWPRPGIYAVRARIDRSGDGGWQDAVASLGWRPMFDGDDLRLEVHIFDHDRDLYGRRLCCAFLERLRAEERFASIEHMQEQMARDCGEARRLLATLPGWTHL